MNVRKSMKAIEENMTHGRGCVANMKHCCGCLAFPCDVSGCVAFPCDGSGCVAFPCDVSGCVAFRCEIANKFVSIRCWERFQIAKEIKKIKSDLDKVKDSEQQVNDSEQRNSKKDPDKEWKNLRRERYEAKTEIVGFEANSKEIIDWLEDGSAKYNVTVLVGMAGQGKTTLAKEIFDSLKKKQILDNKEALGNFVCIAWFRVSDFNNPEQFFRFMLKQFHQKPESLPVGFWKMDKLKLKKEVKEYLKERSYVLFFDDVWNKTFWKEIDDVVSASNENGSRIIITTRSKEVANTCKKSTIVEVQPLSKEESLKMFCQIAFQVDICPNKFVKLSSEILQICEGLPLGIVAIGKLVSPQRNDIFNWKSNLRKVGVTEIFCLGYDNLPHYLKPCLLYFGIYPQGYTVKTKRLIHQWIAEGFVRYEMGRRVEEVAEDYLTSLIDRNLVLVSSFTVDGKPKRCRVHYLVHDMILRKFEDLSFCQCINEENRPDVTGVTRRLSIATNSTEELPGFFDGLVDDIERLFIRSLHFFTKEELPEHFARKIPLKYKQLKVLDFENSRLSYNLVNLGELIHLKYLSFRNTKIESLPKSIDKLENLETLDVRQTDVNEMPKEVAKLRKLRQFLGLVQLKVGIGGMRSLQTLRTVKLDENVGQIENELGKLWQIKDLGLNNVEEKHASALCSAINKMSYLEKLHIATKSETEVIDLQLMKRPSILQKLCLQGKLHRFPEWVPDLDRLTKLVLSGSKFTDDPLNSLKDLPNLLFLSIINEAYVGKILNFEDGGFAGLEELVLGYLNGLTSITAHTTALCSLKKLWLRDILELKTLPLSIQHLENLEHLNYQNMSPEFKMSIASYNGQECKPGHHQACAPCRNKWSAKFVNE